MTNPRNKGAAFERRVAAELFDETGITFKRDLDQYRERDRGDLLPDDSGWPFLMECKCRASGTDCRTAWLTQAYKAAAGTSLYPAVIWKFNNHPVRCRVPFEAIAEAFGGTTTTDKSADLTLQGLAFVAREIMARRALRETNNRGEIN